MLNLLRFAFVPALALPISGCFFGVRHLTEKALAPAHCVSQDAKVGDSFTEGTTTYEVTKLTGLSPYLCRKSPENMHMGADARAL